jgi:hypothetical protein
MTFLWPSGFQWITGGSAATNVDQTQQANLPEGMRRRAAGSVFVQTYWVLLEGWRHGNTWLSVAFLTTNFTWTGLESYTGIRGLTACAIKGNSTFYPTLPNFRKSREVSQASPIVLLIATSRWMWSIGEKILTGENISTGRNPCPSAT